MKRTSSFWLGIVVGIVITVVCGVGALSFGQNLNLTNLRNPQPEQIPTTSTTLPTQPLNTTSTPDSPFEEARVGVWKIFPISVESLDDWQGRKPREGYKFLRIGLAMENIDSDLQPLDEVGRTLGFDLQVETEGGFRYPNFSVRPQSWSTALLPPAYCTPFDGLFELPVNSSGIKLNVRTRSIEQGQYQTSATQIVWILEKEFNKSNSCIPVDTAGFKKLGDPLIQPGVISVTPVKAGLWKNCWSNQTWWEMYLQLQIKNDFGYNLSISNVRMEVISEEGVYPIGPYQPRSGMEDPEWSSLKPQDLADVPPGFTKMGIVGGEVTSHRLTSENWCAQSTEWPATPKNLRLLIALGPISEPQQIKRVWAIYDIEHPQEYGFGGFVTVAPSMPTRAPTR